MSDTVAKLRQARRYVVLVQATEGSPPPSRNPGYAPPKGTRPPELRSAVLEDAYNEAIAEVERLEAELVRLRDRLAAVHDG